MKAQQPDLKMHLLQNLFGGLGVATVAAVAMDVGLQLPNEVTSQYAVAAGMVVFGLFSIVRAFPDEVIWCISVFARVYAEQRNKSEMVTLRQENAALRRMVRQAEKGDAPDDADKALAVAYRVLEEYYLNGLSMSYEACHARGVCSRSTWQWLHDLLVVARVKDASGKVLIHDLTGAWAAFGEAYANSNRRMRTNTGRFIHAAPSHLLQSGD